jgi:hypothetical protein
LQGEGRLFRAAGRARGVLLPRRSPFRAAAVPSSLCPSTPSYCADPFGPTGMPAANKRIRLAAPTPLRFPSHRHRLGRRRPDLRVRLPSSRARPVRSCVRVMEPKIKVFLPGGATCPVRLVSSGRAGLLAPATDRMETGIAGTWPHTIAGAGRDSGVIYGPVSAAGPALAVCFVRFNTLPKLRG